MQGPPEWDNPQLAEDIAKDDHHRDSRPAVSVPERVAIEGAYDMAEHLRRELQEVGWNNITWRDVRGYAMDIVELAEAQLQAQVR